LDYVNWELFYELRMYNICRLYCVLSWINKMEIKGGRDYVKSI